MALPCPGLFNKQSRRIVSTSRLLWVLRPSGDARDPFSRSFPWEGEQDRTLARDIKERRECSSLFGDVAKGGGG